MAVLLHACGFLCYLQLSHLKFTEKLFCTHSTDCTFRGIRNGNNHNQYMRATPGVTFRFPGYCGFADLYGYCVSPSQICIVRYMRRLSFFVKIYNLKFQFAMVLQQGAFNLDGY